MRLRLSIFCVSLSNHVNLSIICKEKQEQPTAATDVKMTIVTAGGRATNVQVSAYHPSKAKEGEKKRKKKKRKKRRTQMESNSRVVKLNASPHPLLPWAWAS